MRYLVLSTAVTDEIHFADGSCLPHVAGGAGIYALAGMKVWTDAVKIVTGVGEDYLGIYGEWYRNNKIPTEGLLVKDAYTPHTVIEYFTDGERIETPRYGEAHYCKIEGTPTDLEPFCADTKGVYIFKNTVDNSFWDAIFELKQKYGFSLMWEIGADVTKLHLCESVRKITQQIDVFSINRTEALTMFGCTTIEEAIKRLHEWNLPMVYLRCGSKGAYALASGSATLVPSVPDCTVVDVTGGGNSSSGGALVGWCETKDAVQAARMGNIAASFCIAQYGIPKLFNDKLRVEANARLERMVKADEK